MKHNFPSSATFPRNVKEYPYAPWTFFATKLSYVERAIKKRHSSSSWGIGSPWLVSRKRIARHRPSSTIHQAPSDKERWPALQASLLHDAPETNEVSPLWAEELHRLGIKQATLDLDRDHDRINPGQIEWPVRCSRITRGSYQLTFERNKWRASARGYRVAIARKCQLNFTPGRFDGVERFDPRSIAVRRCWWMFATISCRRNEKLLQIPFHEIYVYYYLLHFNSSVLFICSNIKYIL